jgi:hypothetical protein
MASVRPKSASTKSLETDSKLKSPLSASERPRARNNIRASSTWFRTTNARQPPSPATSAQDSLAATLVPASSTVSCATSAASR